MRADSSLVSVFALRWGFFNEIGVIEHNLLLQSVYHVVP